MSALAEILMPDVSQDWTLAALADAIPVDTRIRGGQDVVITSICTDSRRVTSGALFVAVPGVSQDGAGFVPDAIAAGAAAIGLAEGVDPAVAQGLPVVETPAVRRFVGEAAAAMAGYPSRDMAVVGITGTGGKTTTTYILEAIARAAGFEPGVIGTNSYRYAGRTIEAPLTTPDAIQIQELLSEMRDAGVTHVFMEVSSHALSLERTAGTDLTCGVYTNFARDHLDYHETIEEYAAAKQKLFTEVLPASVHEYFCVLNGADPETSRVARSLDGPVLLFGRGGDVVAEGEPSLDGLRGRIQLGADTVEFTSRLIGAPHQENISAAAAVALGLGIPATSIVAGLASLPAVPGRLENIDQGQPFGVLVDYAHKPDSLERTLESVRRMASGRVIVVFGCGGDRDRGKRAVMGEIAGRLADLTVITSDNPRTEDPMAIIEAIKFGAQEANCASVSPEALGQDGDVGQFAVVPERPAAIDLAIRTAQPGDVVLIAGKGHEDYQIIGTEKIHLDDREEAGRALGECGYSAGGTGRLV